MGLISETWVAPVWCESIPLLQRSKDWIVSLIMHIGPSVLGLSGQHSSDTYLIHLCIMHQPRSGGFIDVRPLRFALP